MTRYIAWLLVMTLSTGLQARAGSSPASSAAVAAPPDDGRAPSSRQPGPVSSLPQAPVLQDRFNDAAAERLFLQRNLLLTIGIIAKLLLGYFIWRFYREKKKLKEANARLQAGHTELEQNKEALLRQTQLLSGQKEQLEQTNHFKAQLFSIVSHDLRGPVNSLSTLLGLIADEQQPEMQTRKMMPLLLPGIQGVQALLEDILQWAQTQMDGVRIHAEPVDLDDLLQETCCLLHTQAAVKQIGLVVLGTGGTVTTDSAMLKTILRNLVSNAIKYSHIGGQVVLETMPGNDEFSITVRDKGIGIKPETMARLFSSKLRSSEGTASEYGSGVGLMLCRRYVDALNGRISVDTRLDEGTTFTLTLPQPCNPAGKELISAGALA